MSVVGFGEETSAPQENNGAKVQFFLDMMYGWDEKFGKLLPLMVLICSCCYLLE